MVKYKFSTIEARNKCNTAFYVILTGQCISKIILFIQGLFIYDVFELNWE